LLIRVDVNVEVAIQMTANAKFQADDGEVIVLQADYRVEVRAEKRLCLC
jgi:hypothetical protein